MLNSLAYPDAVLAGSSSAAQRLRHQVERVAPHFRTVTLVGEAGCMKEQVARALFLRSPLRDHAFQSCSAASFPGGALTLDKPITLYLSSVGDLHVEQQLILLQRLRQTHRTGRSELRLICSSPVAPRGLVAAGRLQPELYECLSAIEIRVPPLRERLEDLPVLLGELTLHPDALDRLCRHHWPGNLEELYQVLTACMRHAGPGMIGLEHLPPLNVPAVQSEELKLDAVLRKHVNAVLEACAGNKLRAAEMLGISRSTLYRMLDAN